MNTDTVCITLDVDWAPEEAIQDVGEILLRYGIPCTFFATHDSPCLRAFESDAIEIGLHPNLLKPNCDPRTVLTDLKQLYPTAIGGRSHGLVVSSPILSLYQQVGLEYESNIILYGHENLRPVLRFRNFLSIPFFWSDDKYLELNSDLSAANNSLRMPGLKVYNFHPIHIFANTCSLAFYENIKPHYHDAAALKQRRQKGLGIRTVFEGLVAELSQKRDHFAVTNLRSLTRHWMNVECGAGIR